MESEIRPIGRTTSLLRKAFLLAANNPKKAASLLLTVIGLAGGTYPAWLIPGLEIAGKVCFWAAEALKAVN